MSAIAGIRPGHAIASAPQPPAPFVPGEPLFNTIETAVPYQALVGDLVLTTSNSVTAPAGAADGEYFAVKNLGVASVTIVGSVDGGAYVLEPSTLSGAQHSVWFVWNAASATWRIVSEYNPVGPFRWVWANAAARIAQSVVAAEIGFYGYQVDIALEYQLLAVGPTRWGPMMDPAMGVERVIAVRNGANTYVGAGYGIDAFPVSGSTVARPAGGATPSLRLIRVGQVTGGGAGSTAIVRILTNSGAPCEQGARLRAKVVLDAVTAAERWFFGVCDAIGAANVNPNTFLNSIGIGRGAGEANLQLFHNDNAGLATQVDLGAAFPAISANLAYELEIYTLAGTSYGVQVRNVDSEAQISLTLAADLPIVSGLLNWCMYSSNNTDAASVGLCLASIRMWQREY